jgi:ATP-binding cassette subfamily C protein CydD
MRNGKILQQGDHAELMRSPGAFAELAARRQETVE